MGSTPQTPGLVYAAGGILQRGTEIVVVHRPTHHDWGLPKGKLNPGEALETAALREVLEETGCQSRIVKFVGKTEYPYRGRLKSVSFWLMELVEEHPFRPNDEIDELAWLPPAGAFQRLDYPQERELVRKVFRLYSSITSSQDSHADTDE